MNSGVYAIIHIESGKRYIGSAKCFDQRFAKHLKDLRSGTHYNSYLQAAWNKYGEDAFEFKKIVGCLEELAVNLEQAMINLFGFENLYNLCPTAGNTLGRVHTEETKAKMRKPKSEEFKKNMSQKMQGNKKFLGKKHSEETKEKMREAWKAREPMSDETKAKIRIAVMKHLTEGRNNG